MALTSALVVSVKTPNAKSRVGEWGALEKSDCSSFMMMNF
jgi:hypothetical protein